MGPVVTHRSARIGDIQIERPTGTWCERSREVLAILAEDPQPASWTLACEVLPTTDCDGDHPDEVVDVLDQPFEETR